MTPFKENITKSIDNLNKLQEDVENTITDLQEQVVDLEEQIEEMEDLETKNVTITTNTETTIEPTTGKYALDKVVVTTNVQPNLEEKSVTITENTTTNITPSSGYDGISSVAVTTNIASAKVIVDYSKFNTTSGIENQLTNCITKVTNIALDSAGGTVTSLRYLFQNLPNLTEFASFDTSSVTAMGVMCYGCISLKKVPNLDTSSVQNFYQCFYSCQSLEDLPILDFSAVTGNTPLQNIIYDCRSLTDESYHNLIKSLLSVPNTYSGTKSLYMLGIRSANKANLCMSFDEWATLSANGWTSGVA